MIFFSVVSLECLHIACNCCNYLICAGEQDKETSSLCWINRHLSYIYADHLIVIYFDILCLLLIFIFFKYLHIISLNSNKLFQFYKQKKPIINFINIEDQISSKTFCSKNCILQVFFIYFCTRRVDNYASNKTNN